MTAATVKSRGFAALCSIPEISLKSKHDLQKMALLLILRCGAGRQDRNRKATIHQIEEQQPETVVFQAGTRQADGQIVTSGGRVLGVTAVAANIPAARQLAYQAAEQIHFDGVQYRRDIAAGVG